MKMKGAKQVHYDSGPNMTPLVDVVMCILIFLMLAGSFAGTAHFLQSKMPITDKGAGGAPPPDGFVPDEPLDIRVDVPDYQDAKSYVATVGNLQATGYEPLKQALQRRLAAFEGASIKRDKIQVVINPQSTVYYENLIEVYQAALDAGFTKVSFATSH